MIDAIRRATLRRFDRREFLDVARRAETPAERVIRMAEVRHSTARDEDRSIECVVATDAKLLGRDRLFDLVDQVLVIRADMDLPVSAPLIDTHDTSTARNVMGSVRDFRVERKGDGYCIIGRAYFADTTDGRDMYVKYRDKHLTDVSVGAIARAVPEAAVRIEPNTSREIDGEIYRAGNRPLIIFRFWDMRDVSACVRGQDPAAKVLRSLLRKGQSMKFNQWLKEKGHNPEELDEAKRAELFEDYLKDRETALRAEIEEAARKEAEDKATAGDENAVTRTDDKPVDVEAVARTAATEALKVERARVAAIREVCAGEHAEIERKAIDEEQSIEEVQRAVLKAVREGRSEINGSVNVIVRNSEVQRSVIEGALILRAGGDEKDIGNEEVANRADEVRENSLIDVCRMALRLEGIDEPHNRHDLIARAASTASLTNIVSNVANKFMLKGYNVVNPTAVKWCGEQSVSDYKQITGLRLTGASDLEEIGDNGEVKHDELDDEAETAQLKMYGKLVGLSEKNIVNDDLGALTKISQRQGAAAARKVDDVAYTVLLANAAMADGTALFHADHSNLATGATSALDAANGATAVQAGVGAMLAQKDSDGNNIGAKPHYLLCCPENYFEGLRLVKSAQIIGTLASGKIMASDNVMAGFIPEANVIVEPRLSNTSFHASALTTAWYLAANPGIIDTVTLFYLNGVKTPRLEKFTNTPNFVGVQLRVVFSVAAGDMDHRGLYKAAGA